MLHPMRRACLSAVSLLLLLSLLFGCVGLSNSPLPNESGIGETLPDIASLQITNGDRATLAIGESLLLRTNVEGTNTSYLIWSASNDAATVSDAGLVTAQRLGKVIVTVAYGDRTARILIEVVAPQETVSQDAETETTLDGPTVRPDDQPALSPDRDSIPEAVGSPEGYQPAASYEEAVERTAQGDISGFLYVPDQEPNIDPDRPMSNGQYIRNNEAYFADENTYVVVDAEGLEVFRVYRGGGYITLEEVAAYLYAFGDVPANYIAGKKMDPENSIWGSGLRLNHSRFSGSTTKYPYEPALPRISGCGGDLQYYEIDIGTTGTDCDPGYSVRTYNDGQTITRGAARIVYARFDQNGNKVIEPEEKFIFYTYNHYNDFREYLNYYNGWGEMFGNITGGGTLSSKYDYHPTPYVEVILAPLSEKTTSRAVILSFLPYRREDGVCDVYRISA